tara:strand:+ start:132 stop:689 length:558 start_codon:yes stop_codon:yes gene_type:complete
MELGFMKESYREALLGFAACAAGTVVIYAAMYLSAPVLAERHVARIVQISGDTEELALASLVESARHKATDFIKLLLPTFAIYWFVAGLGGRTPLLKARHANALLIAGSSGVIAIAASSYFYWAETYCDQLPYPHKGFQILRINECPSSQIFFSSLFWISAAFFLASLIVRLVRSRNSAPAKAMP